MDNIQIHSLPSLPIPDRYHLPKIGAVYFVLSESDSIEYIGKAKNLFKRWRTHECCMNLDNPKSCRVAWIEIEGETERIEFEKKAISTLKPRYNINYQLKPETIIVPVITEQNSKFITTKEAADELKVSTAYIRQMIIAGTITGAKKFGRDNAVPKSEIERLKQKERRVGRPKEKARK